MQHMFGAPFHKHGFMLGDALPFPHVAQAEAFEQGRISVIDVFGLYNSPGGIAEAESFAQARYPSRVEPGLRTHGWPW